LCDRLARKRRVKLTFQITSGTGWRIAEGGVPGKLATSPVYLLGYRQSVVDLDAEVPHGILAQGPTGVVRLAQSRISGNQTGYSVSSNAVLTSFGDNYIADNGSNTGTLTSINKQ
jgi:hypothetical protein